MLIRKRYSLPAIAAIAIALAYIPFGPRPGHVFDEAKLAGLTASAFDPIRYVDVANDFFRDMDRGVTLDTKNEINGRNMWILWTGGDDRFWNASANLSFGNVDLLKTVSSYDPDKDPSLDAAKRQYLRGLYRSRRSNRWDYLGAINEPCFTEAAGPDPKRYGLWLDRRKDGCTPDPFEDENKYPGVKIGARGKNVPVGSYYGYASGIVGLRLFPNPDFDEAAAKKWDPVRYYSDPAYYKSKDLVRPFRVGMSCGFCHIGPNPVHPPPDPESPGWEHLSTIAGAQYLWVDRIFSWEGRADNFIAQIFQTWRPGTVDVSFVSQDNIDNPRSMNAIYRVPARMELAKRFGKEHLGDDNRAQKQLNDFVAPDNQLAGFFQPPGTVYTMRILKDGSDSVGVLASLNRVYLNIGEFSEEWLLHFRPLVGGKHITPIDVPTLRRNSVFWQATEAQSFDMAAFLIKAGKPHLLSDVPPGELPAADAITVPPETLEIGRLAFADRCLRCHSSRLPPVPPDANPGNCEGANYLECWNRYWQYTQTEVFKQEARLLVQRDDFLENNYLSTDFRVPITLLKTNACASLATNAIAGNVWDNFSSATYKSLPAVGKAEYYQPFTGEKLWYEMPGGGRGYIRPASLVSLWSTAPFLLNNSVGPFLQNPSVKSRLASYQASITQLLWPATREQDSLLGSRIPGRIDRTTTPSYIRVPAGYLPGAVRPFVGMIAAIMPSLFNSENVQKGVVIGPIPAGMPIGLLSNLQTVLDHGSTLDELTLDRNVLSAVLKLGSALNDARGKSAEEARSIVFSSDVTEALMKVSKCPDYVVNKGHYFGAEGADGEVPLTNDQRAAIALYLRTF